MLAMNYFERMKEKYEKLKNKKDVISFPLSHRAMKQVSQLSKMVGKFYQTLLPHKLKCIEDLEGLFLRLHQGII